MSKITIHKRDHLGRPVWHYEGEVIERTEHGICIQARFGRDDVDSGVITFRKGDLMTEWFYDDRYYNIFQVQDVGDAHIKGWYCNITRPAEITESNISADDLALDVFVSPQGIVTLLDEDDYAELELTDEEHQQVENAVNTIREYVAKKIPPFDAISG